MNLTPIEIYILIVLISAAIRYPLALLNLKIIDNENADYYIPTLYKEYSISYDKHSGFYSYRTRGKILTWIIFPLVPVYWILQLFLIFKFVYCRLEFFLNYGEYPTKVDLNKYKNNKILENEIQRIEIQQQEDSEDFVKLLNDVFDKKETYNDN